MPPRKFKRSRKYRPRNKMLISRNMQNDFKIVKLRYGIEEFSLTSTAGSTASRRWRCNDIFDPLYETGGHQPRGHDQWFLFYARASVLGSKITINLCYEDGLTSHHGTFASLCKYASATLPGGTEAIEEMQGPGVSHRTKLMHPQSNASVTLTKNFSYREVFRDRKSCLADYNYQSASTASPTTGQFVYHCTVRGINANTQTVYGHGYIDYVVCFSRPIMPAES